MSEFDRKEKKINFHILGPETLFYFHSLLLPQSQYTLKHQALDANRFAYSEDLTRIFYPLLLFTVSTQLSYYTSMLILVVYFVELHLYFSAN